MSLKDEARILSLENQVRDMAEQLEHLEAVLFQYIKTPKPSQAPQPPATNDETSNWLNNRFRKKKEYPNRY